MSKYSEEFAKTHGTVGKVKKETEELVKDEKELGEYFGYYLRKKVKYKPVYKKNYKRKGGGK